MANVVCEPLRNPHLYSVGFIKDRVVDADLPGNGLADLLFAKFGKVYAPVLSSPYFG